jgi:hypothetical protein
MKRNFVFLALSFHVFAVVRLLSCLLSQSSSTPNSPIIDIITLVCVERNLLILEPCHCCSARNSTSHCKALTSPMQVHIAYKWHTLLLRTVLLLSFVGIRSWNISVMKYKNKARNYLRVEYFFSNNYCN